MDNYTTRTHLYLARHPIKSVCLKNQLPGSDFNRASVIAFDSFDTLKDELLEAIRKLVMC